LDSIERDIIRNDGLTPEAAKEAKDEFLRYISLLFVTKRRVFAPRAADIFWHAFITDTLAYGKFCQDLFGKFIHHIPGRYNESRDQQNQETVDRTVSLFRDMYGIQLDVSPKPQPDGALRSFRIECECGGEDGY